MDEPFGVSTDVGRVSRPDTLLYRQVDVGSLDPTYV
jgi:hypothetical protein